MNFLINQFFLRASAALGGEAMFPKILLISQNFGQGFRRPGRGCQKRFYFNKNCSFGRNIHSLREDNAIKPGIKPQWV
jgi:hypothetical protein